MQPENGCARASIDQASLLLFRPVDAAKRQCRMPAGLLMVLNGCALARERYDGCELYGQMARMKNLASLAM